MLFLAEWVILQSEPNKKLIIITKDMNRKIIVAASLLFAFAATTQQASAQQYGLTTENSEQNTPQGWTSVQLPQVPAITSANTFDITSYGASTSSSDNTEAVQSALNAVGDEGGMVVIPKGTWLCGPITLKSKTILHFAKGATLKVLPLGQYPGTEDYMSYTSKKASLANFIDVVKGATDIIIEGEDSASCVIDGQGAPWWALRDRGGNYKTVFNNMKRGALIRFTSGSRFLVKNLKFENAPGVNVCLGQSGNASNFTVHDIEILAPASTIKYKSGNAVNPSHNTDGIPMWGPYINIYNCYISTGDDNVVVDSKGQYVHVWNCTFGTGHGASIGSFTQGVHDVIYEGITFNKTESGFKIKSQKGRSGSVHDIIFRNSTMNGVLGNDIELNCWYDGVPSSPSSATRSDSTSTTPYYNNILVQNVVATGTPYNSSSKGYFPLFIYGLPESYVANVTFDNVQLSAGKGMFMAYARGIKFQNGCKITNTRNASKYFETQYNAYVSGDYTGAETPTGISSPVVENKTDNAWYTITGVSLGSQPTSKGIYIHDGKKLIVK